jgi:hypothetical protein
MILEEVADKLEIICQCRSVGVASGTIIYATTQYLEPFLQGTEIATSTKEYRGKSKLIPWQMRTTGN